jgi:dienelactone hydrolase
MSEAGRSTTVTRTGRGWAGMVEDARAAIDALQKDSLVDPQRIYLFGYSMGGMVGPVYGRAR